jgi:hypothetical protein
VQIVYIVGFVLLLCVIFLFVLILASPNNDATSCPVGECPTNTLTGNKRCNDSQLRPLDVCNPQFACTSPATPYALRGDGGINSDGICDDNIPCPCVATTRCPRYIASIFNATTPSNDTNLSFTQNSVPGPITSSFCSLSPDSLVLGPCNYFEDMTYDNLVQCASLDAGCDANLLSRPCNEGTLALITPNPDGVTSSNYLNYTVGCLYTEKCPCNQLPIYDTRSNTRICRAL